MISWNRCEDVMPDTVGEYLIYYNEVGHQYIDIAYISDDVFIIDNEPVRCPTHWAELNKPVQK